MDLIAHVPEFDLYNAEWPIYSNVGSLPPAKFVHADSDRLGHATESMVCPGAIISGGEVNHSVIATNVRVHSWSQVVDSVIMDNCAIHRNARVYKAILDKDVIVEENAAVGLDHDRDSARGLTITPRRYHCCPEGYCD